MAIDKYLEYRLQKLRRDGDEYVLLAELDDQINELQYSIIDLQEQIGYVYRLYHVMYDILKDRLLDNGRVLRTDDDESERC